MKQLHLLCQLFPSQKKKKIIAYAFTVTSKARSVGAHPLSSILSWQGKRSIVHCAGYRAYCIATLCQSSPDTRPGTQLKLSRLKQCTWLHVACLKPLLWGTVGFEPTPSELNRFTVGRSNHCATQPVNPPLHYPVPLQRAMIIPSFNSTQCSLQPKPNNTGADADVR